MNGLLEACLDRARKIYEDMLDAANKQPTEVRQFIKDQAEQRYKAEIAKCLDEEIKRRLPPPPEHPSPVPREPAGPTTAPTPGGGQPPRPVPSDPWAGVDQYPILTNQTELIYFDAKQVACWKIKFIGGTGSTDEPMLEVWADGKKQSVLKWGEESRCVCGNMITLRLSGVIGYYQYQSCKPEAQ
ncbi:MAG: hypothetical protein HYW95_02450 [Candidatus Wildermuthbacteria bacterium]|nr:hypothetical protein [Candidatus Wildermuthbacteria bacterium]